MNPLIQGHSGTAPETSWNAYGSNQETNEDDSQSDPHPEAGIFQSQTTQRTLAQKMVTTGTIDLIAPAQQKFGMWWAKIFARKQEAISYLYTNVFEDSKKYFADPLVKVDFLENVGLIASSYSSHK